MAKSRLTIAALLLALAGCDAAAITNTMPNEVLVPAHTSTLYIGDKVDCTAEAEGLWRYASDKSLVLCTQGAWQVMTITREAQ